MKDSGISWIGEIPAHWTVSRLKHISPQITVGIVVTPAKCCTDSGVPCPRSLNIKPGMILQEPMVFISPEANELHSSGKSGEVTFCASELVSQGRPLWWTIRSTAQTVST